MACKIERQTDRTVTSKSERGMHADGAGHYLRAGDGGSNKSWVFRFKQKRDDGKFRARDMGLGGYPTASLAEARDVAQPRLAEARGVTFRECAERGRLEKRQASPAVAQHSRHLRLSWRVS